MLIFLLKNCKYRVAGASLLINGWLLVRQYFIPYPVQKTVTNPKVIFYCKNTCFVLLCRGEMASGLDDPGLMQALKLHQHNSQ